MKPAELNELNELNDQSRAEQDMCPTRGGRMTLKKKVSYPTRMAQGMYPKGEGRMS